MSIRYERQGAKIVRVETPPAPKPAPDTPRLPLRPPPPRPNSVLVRSGLLLVAAEGLRSERRRLLALRYKDEADRRREAKRLGRPPEQGRDCPPEVLLEARKAAGLSQRDLARETPFGRSLIAECERGRRSVPPQLADWARRVLRASSASSKGVTL